MVKFFGYRYLFKINGRYRRMLFNSKKRKAKRKNATNPRGPQHLKFKYGNRIKNITRRGQMKKLFLRLSKRGRRRFLSNIRNQSAARSASTAIRSRSRFLSVRYVSLLGRSNGVLVGAIKNIVLRSTSLPKKFVTIRTTTPSCGGVLILKPKPLLH